MRPSVWLVLGIVAAVGVACSGDEFSSSESGGAAGVGGGGAGGSAATAGTSNGGTSNGGTSNGGTSGASGGGSGGAAGAAGVPGAGGAGGGTSGCSVPGAPLWSTAVDVSPDHPVAYGNYLYFTTATAIGRVALANGTFEKLYTIGASLNEGVALVGKSLAWAGAGFSVLGVLDVDNPQSPQTITGQQGIHGVAADAATFYWTSDYGIRRFNGGVADDLYPSQGAHALVVQDGDVFWVTTSGSVHKAPANGNGPVVNLGSAPAQPWSEVSLAVDATHVYFTARIASTASLDGGVPPDGVWRLPRTGGNAQQVLPSAGAEGIALTEDCVYWGTRHVNGRVYFRDKTLATSPQNVGNFDYPRGLAIANDVLYVVDAMAGKVHALPL